MITKEQVEAIIEEEVYWTTHQPDVFGEDGQLMICVLKTKAGFECFGHSGTITPRDNWDPELAQSIAREKAFAELWGKLAFYMQHKLNTDDFSDAEKIEALRAMKSHSIKLSAQIGIFRSGSAKEEFERRKELTESIILKLSKKNV